MRTFELIYSLKTVTILGRLSIFNRKSQPSEKISSHFLVGEKKNVLGIVEKVVWINSMLFILRQVEDYNITKTLR